MTKGEERQDAVFTFTAEQIKDVLAQRLKRCEARLAYLQAEGEPTKYVKVEAARLHWLLKASLRGGTFTYDQAVQLLGDCR